MSAMAQGLFASLLIGTIISTLGSQLGVPLLEEIGNFAKEMADAGIESDIVSPKLLPDYRRKK